ncbi:MAG: 4-aminobutyrate--2-oxoglutarate transaminase [Thermoleophilia bacterium]|nr:4-aminobutyrate--2-oxoglutarate transaminase [Thermoleophilia bacterium]
MTDFIKLRAESLPRGVATATTAMIARARNAIVVDTEGREYIDFAGGIGVMNVGHSHPKVLAAAHAQLDRFAHTCVHVFGYEAYVRLAAKMNEKAPGPTPKRSYFVNSGAEAVENAVKIARCATGRPGIVALENAFHGRTNLTMGLTSKIAPYKKDFGPFTPEIYRIPYAYCYRCPLNLKYPGCGVACAELLREGFENEFQPEKIACVIAEPVQGEGGFIVPPPDYHQKLKAICEEHGIVYIADEVQTGFGRTGRLFAMEHFGVEADIMTTAKSLGAGYPISGVTGKAEVMDIPHPGGLGGTYGGNPLGCEVALAVLDIMEEERLPERAVEIGRRVTERFTAMQQRFAVIGDVRGLGAMVGMELVEDRDTKKPATALTKAYRVKLFENGLINVIAGTYDNVVRTLMPLTIEWETLERGLDIMEETLAQVTSS